MPAKFYDGISVKSTNTLSQAGKVAPPQKNSMKGMPGFLRTTQDRSDGGLKGGPGVGPKREGEIGHRGSSGNPKMPTDKLRGSSDKSYRATSTGPAAKIQSNKGEPTKRGASEKEGPKRGKPTKGAHQTTEHRGKMESLRGKARTSWEK